MIYVYVVTNIEMVFYKVSTHISPDRSACT